MLKKTNKKLMIQFQENTQTDRWTDRRTDGQILFYRILLTIDMAQLSLTKYLIL